MEVVSPALFFCLRHNYFFKTTLINKHLSISDKQEKKRNGQVVEQLSPFQTSQNTIQYNTIHHDQSFLSHRRSAPPCHPLYSLRETSRSVYDELFCIPNEWTRECFAIVRFEFFKSFDADDGVDNEED
jgi:hypothetical protein